MNHQVLLALVSGVWVASEVMVGFITRRSRGEVSKHDRGSHTLLWMLLIGTIFAAAQLRFLKIGRMPGTGHHVLGGHRAHPHGNPHSGHGNFDAAPVLHCPGAPL